MSAQTELIQNLIRLNRQAARELAKVEMTTSADFSHINQSLSVLNEQFHLLLQQKEEQEMATPVEPIAARKQDSPKEKRGRGATKQFYLKDKDGEEAFIAQLQRIILKYYQEGKKFFLPDGTIVSAPCFLACLYDLGIKHGLNSPEAPVKNFADLVEAAASRCPNALDFNTAYNTLQKATKRWNPLIEKREKQLYGITVRFHQIQPADVSDSQQESYTTWQTLYTQVEQIFLSTAQA